MFAFRDAFDEGDAEKRIDQRIGGERVIAGRGSLRRRGADEARLKRNLAIDLLSLVNTINFASSEDISGLDYVGRSVLNFGLRDISNLTSLEVGINQISGNLRDALLHHEPRLVSGSLRIEKDQQVDVDSHRIQFNVSAEMACTPLDIPMEFVAEVDVGSGKVSLTRLPVTT
ncbi:MAG: GPW/gp25 family protein [Pseudaminobacter sp.]|nr:GPW/gp25 family protein [Pseudaminobacter sp.]